MIGADMIIIQTRSEECDQALTEIEVSCVMWSQDQAEISSDGLKLKLNNFDYLDFFILLFLCVDHFSQVYLENVMRIFF